MIDIIYKAGVLVAIILLGYVTKTLGLFSKEEDFSTLSKIILYITLPSAIIIKLNGLRFPPSLLIISVIGFLCNWMYLFIAKYFGKDKQEQSFMALSINGYNIGNFALPFIAFFLEGLPILAISLFDAGSSIMVLGGNYAMAKNMQKEDAKFDIPDLLGTIIQSPTIIVYVVMVILSLSSINLPNIIIDITSIAGAANTFLAMFMIGIVLEFNFEQENIKKLGKYALLRYIPAFILAVLIFFVPFLPIEIKYTLTLIIFAPISGSAPIFTNLMEGDVELSAQINSLSIILSIVFMSAYLIYLGV